VGSGHHRRDVPERQAVMPLLGVLHATGLGELVARGRHGSSRCSSVRRQLWSSSSRSSWQSPSVEFGHRGARSAALAW
jgi:hypothetical protein